MERWIKKIELEVLRKGEKPGQSLKINVVLLGQKVFKEVRGPDGNIGTQANPICSKVEIKKNGKTRSSYRPIFLAASSPQQWKAETDDHIPFPENIGKRKTEFGL